ncbi:unnamed protein product [Didymodactylos carnosus]|uniref:Integrase catalytic domain-containing protein n=1 Tax=Didymodactylos carnosus TaxID=1234261 RepID=A0A8S2VKA0_9BILA|nr:unnamed protein product [Didymodactylos carnosus]
MDYHGPIIPSSARGHKYIISITDIMSKFVIAKAVRHNSAKTAAEFLQQEVITKYGTPRCILTDNGSHFTAMMFNNLLKSTGATHLYSTSYHPQTNGQIERFNATMDAKIAVLANERKTNWHEQLPFVTFIYNTSVHATTKHIPFELMYGRKPVLPFDPQSSVVSTMERDEYLEYAKDCISSLTQDMKRIVLNENTRRNQTFTSPRTIGIESTRPNRTTSAHTRKKGWEIRRDKKNEQIKQACSSSYYVAPSEFQVYHIDKETSETTVDYLIEAAHQTNAVTVDTESDHYTDEPALVQVQLIRINGPSPIILFECAHLPSSTSSLFKQIQRLSLAIFNSGRTDYSWGELRKEFEPFQCF